MVILPDADSPSARLKSVVPVEYSISGGAISREVASIYIPVSISLEII